jgi:DNA-binding NarL/FixJ family response regulator
VAERCRELGIIIEGTDRAPRYRRGKADVATPMRSTEAEGTKLEKPLGLVWIKCPYPVLAAGVEEVLKEVAHVHYGKSPPAQSPSSCIVLLLEDEEDVTSEVKDLLALVPNTPVLIFSSRVDDQRLAKAAFKAGACGILHVGMRPEQIIRTIKVALEGEALLSQKLLKALLACEEVSSAGIAGLTHRQLEILKLVTEGLSNAQIAEQLFLSESTVKQHLRRAYKTLGVRSRSQAAALFR